MSLDLDTNCDALGSRTIFVPRRDPHSGRLRDLRHAHLFRLGFNVRLPNLVLIVDRHSWFLLNYASRYRILFNNRLLHYNLLNDRLWLGDLYHQLRALVVVVVTTAVQLGDVG